MATIELPNGTRVELNVDAEMAPSALWMFAGKTPGDEAVDALPLVDAPLVIAHMVRLLRWYRRVAPKSLGNRCVFDPSCSRYAELSVRKYGFWVGWSKTIYRLLRCRPGAGGVDFP